jgi:NADH dehydrogenase FAD-containing subunit
MNTPRVVIVGGGFTGLGVSGGLTWVPWLAVHLWALAQPGMRVGAFVQWLWTLLTSRRGSRLIVNYGGTDRHPAHAD